MRPVCPQTHDQTHDRHTAPAPVTNYLAATLTASLRAASPFALALGLTLAPPHRHERAVVQTLTVTFTRTLPAAQA